MTYITLDPKDAEAYKYASSSKTVFDNDDKWHALQDLTEGDSEGWTWVAGTRGTDITTTATYDGGDATLITTTADHNLSAGDYVTITGTTNYNVPCEVLSVPSAKTFEIDVAWVANDDTGTYARGDSYTADTSSAGVYDFTWSVTVDPDAANKTLTGGIMINKTVCTKCRARDYFSKSQYETGGSGANITIANSDKVCIVMKNMTDSTDITIRHANFRIHRIRKS